MSITPVSPRTPPLWRPLLPLRDPEEAPSAPRETSPLLRLQLETLDFQAKERFERQLEERLSALPQLFLSFLGERGYACGRPHPLAANDPTLTFINSTIAPYKPQILAGERVGLQAVVQPCFRARESDEYLYGFSMLGMMADREHLAKTSHDIVDFLCAAGIPRERLIAVLNAADAALWDVMDTLFPPNKLQLIPQNNDTYNVSWRFGQEGFQGVGLTIAAEVQGSLVLPLGNIILARNPSGIEYVDVGFGIECIQSWFYGGSIWQIPLYRRQTEMIQSLRIPKPQQFLKELLGFAMLQKEGIKPSSKGAGYVAKKMQTRLFEVLLDLPRERIFPCLADIAGGEPAVSLKRGFDAYLEALPNHRRRAEAFLRSRNLPEEEARKELRTTFGLPPQWVEQLLQKKES